LLVRPLTATPPPGVPFHVPVVTDAGSRRESPGEVTAVLCAAFDAAADERVRTLRERLGPASPRLRRPPLHRPHVTLGATRTALAELPAVHRLAADVAARNAAFDLPLDHVGIFPRGGVLWLAPAPSEDLAALQADADAALVAAGHTRAFDTAVPARWVPHCTLATGLRPDELAGAVELLARRWRPLRARVELVVTLLVGRPDQQVHPHSPPASGYC
jgi:2'-5' RNA ligase